MSGLSLPLSKFFDDHEKKLKAGSNPIKTISDVVLDPSDGDFSLKINGHDHLWIDNNSVIEIADYIEQNIMQTGYIAITWDVLNVYDKNENGTEFKKVSELEIGKEYSSPKKLWFFVTDEHHGGALHEFEVTFKAKDVDQKFSNGYEVKKIKIVKEIERKNLLK